MSETKRISKKKIIKITALSLAALLIAGAVTAGFVLYGRVASILSVKQVADELYTMNFRQDYHLDKALEAGIKSKNDLMKFICDDMFFGYQMKSGPIRYACSAFSTETADAAGTSTSTASKRSRSTHTLTAATPPSRQPTSASRGSEISGSAVFEHRGKNSPSCVAVPLC